MGWVVKIGGRVTVESTKTLRGKRQNSGPKTCDTRGTLMEQIRNERTERKVPMSTVLLLSIVLRE